MKALQRRAQCYDRVKEFDKAIADMNTVCEVANSVDNETYLNSLKAKQKAILDQQKKMYSKMFS